MGARGCGRIADSDRRGCLNSTVPGLFKNFAGGFSCGNVSLSFVVCCDVNNGLCSDSCTRSVCCQENCDVRPSVLSS